MNNMVNLSIWLIEGDWRAMRGFRGVCIPALIVLLLAPIRADELTYVSQSTLIGQWTFDNTGGTSELANKVAGVNWSPLTLSGSGATVRNGMLILPRFYDNSGWQQSCATAMLKTDLGPDGYFKEMTLVAWIKWPGYDINSWGRFLSLGKFTGPAYELWKLKAMNSVIFCDAGLKWGAFFRYEDSDGSNCEFLSTFGGANPPIDECFKVAQVVKQRDAASYDVVFYIDYGDGLTEIGRSIIWTLQAITFGQAGSLSFLDASGGPRYDGIGFQDYVQNCPVTPGEIQYEEARLYAGALSAAQIGDLRCVGESGTAKPVFGIANKNVLSSIMTSAAQKYNWVLWGMVRVINVNSFLIDDGSDTTIKVNAPDHNCADGDYVSVQGSLDINTKPPTLTATKITKQK